MERRSRNGASGTRSRSSTRAETMTGWISRPTISGAASARDHNGWSRSRPRTSVVGLIAGWYVSGTQADSSRTSRSDTLMSDMRGRGASVGVFALTIGVVLAGGMVLRSGEPARLALRGADVRRGMGPQGVGPWVKENFDLRSTWRNGGTIDTIKSLVANGFAPMVTQWMQDPWVSRIAHWRTVRGYDDATGVGDGNDSMLGNMLPLPYEWFGRNWQSVSYRYMVIYRPEDEKLLKAIMGPQVSDAVMRRDLYQRAKTEALTQNTNFAWLAYGEAAYSFGMFEEAVAAFEKGLSMGSPNGVFGLRNSYPQALRALGRQQDAERAAQQLNSISVVPSSTVVAPPDPYALYLAMLRTTPIEQIPTE